MSGNSYSLDYWRKLFRSTNASIFEVVDNAVLVAAVDFPTEFARRRDEIVERIFTCPLFQRSGCDQGHELPSSVEENDEIKAEEEREDMMGNEPNNGDESKHTHEDTETPSNEVEEASRVVGDITRIHEVLKKWRLESESVLLESMQRLQSMEISTEILKVTEIGRTVKLLIGHESEEIQLLAQALTNAWRNAVKESANDATKSEDPTPDSAASPPPVEEGGLAFPPWDEAALLAAQTTSIELTTIFDGIDDNGNIETCGQSQENHRRRPPKDGGENRKQEASSKQMRPLEACNRLPEPQYHGEKGIKASSQVSPPEADRLPKPHDEGEKWQNQMASRQTRPLEAPSRPSKPNGEGKRKLQESIPAHQRPLEAQNELLNPHHQLRKYHKLVEDDSWPSVASGRPPRTAFEHKASAETQFQHNQGPSNLPKRPPSIMLAAPQQSDDWFLAQEKLETAKRKLQEGYRQAENAKKQRTIQVVELSNMPKHSQNQRQPPLNFRHRATKKLVR